MYFTLRKYVYGLQVRQTSVNLGFSELQFKCSIPIKHFFFVSLFSLSDVVRRGLEKLFSFSKSNFMGSWIHLGVQENGIICHDVLCSCFSEYSYYKCKSLYINILTLAQVAQI